MSRTGNVIAIVTAFRLLPTAALQTTSPPLHRDGCSNVGSAWRGASSVADQRLRPLPDRHNGAQESDQGFLYKTVLASHYR